MTPSSSPKSRLPDGITRELLESDGLRAVVRARHPEVTLNDDAVMQASIAQMLASAPPEAAAVDGVWVFGYGSLLWNPCVAVAQWLQGRVYGYHRDFRIRLTHGRGSPEAPGLMLGLDTGGSCTGMGLRIDVDDLHHELLMVWRREMLTGVYQPRWVWLQTAAGRVPALTFVTDRQGHGYCGRLNESDKLQLLATGHGFLGSCVEYLVNTVAQLDEQGIHDHYLHYLRRHVVG